MRAGFFSRLVKLNWRISIILAALVLVFFRKLLPGVPVQDLKLIMLVRVGAAAAPYLSALLMVAALFALRHARYRERLFLKQAGLHTIRRLSEDEFQILVGEAFRRQGYRVAERPFIGPGALIHLRLKKGRHTIFVLCNNQKAVRIGLEYVNHLFSIVLAKNADRAMLVTSGAFTTDAERFALNRPIDLLPGERLAELIAKGQSKQDPTKFKLNLP